jgi:SPP1 family predicted phage head-tail adaptor
VRAGALDRVIEIQSRSTGLDLYGTPIDVWTTAATVRAQILQDDTTNREGARPTTDATITFRIYWTDRISLESRVVYDDQVFKIQKIREIGRRAGLDLVVERVGP